MVISALLSAKCLWDLGYLAHKYFHRAGDSAHAAEQNRVSPSSLIHKHLIFTGSSNNSWMSTSQRHRTRTLDMDGAYRPLPNRTIEEGRRDALLNGNECASESPFRGSSNRSAIFADMTLTGKSLPFRIVEAGPGCVPRTASCHRDEPGMSMCRPRDMSRRFLRGTVSRLA